MDKPEYVQQSEAHNFLSYFKIQICHSIPTRTDIVSVEWPTHKPEYVQQSEAHNFLWYFKIQIYHPIPTRTDIVSVKWPMHKPEYVQQSEAHNFLWYFKIQICHPIPTWTEQLTSGCSSVSQKENKRTRKDKYLDLASGVPETYWPLHHEFFGFRCN